MPILPIYLASASPRRGQLLEQLGIAYRRVEAEVDERMLVGESAEAYVCRVALAKAQAGWRTVVTTKTVARPVLGADTCISLDGRILGKPRDRAHGLEMLAALSGRRHEVWSAVALVDGERESVKVSCSQVAFRAISAQECERYWDTGEPADKAGAYAIQGKGAMFIAGLDGSYSGVMGLPLFETAELLNEYGIEVM